MDDGAQLFDRKQEFSIGEHSRPHWTQSGAITFSTLRLKDSIPREVIERWDQERLSFPHQHGILCENWRTGREQLTRSGRRDFEKHFNRIREDELDTCRGKCLLRDTQTAKLIADSLMHFDEDRYLMGDFVVMPNHVHLLAVFPDGESMGKQCTSWMRYTATRVNRSRGESGPLWQSEPFDHLVRSEVQLEYLRDYIAMNPSKAGLGPSDYLYRRSERQF